MQSNTHPPIKEMSPSTTANRSTYIITCFRTKTILLQNQKKLLLKTQMKLLLQKERERNWKTFSFFIRHLHGRIHCHTKLGRQSLNVKGKMHRAAHDPWHSGLTALFICMSIASDVKLTTAQWDIKIKPSAVTAAKGLGSRQKALSFELSPSCCAKMP